ncbi:HD domain-containing protein [Shouchella shacheensis]|uniref:HD domain-containing protein n=1 Tax=Shouchella shacheensis TaxID=1649580 RepID=UPI00073FAABB|nr:HD domain-containing protein [Shouchella shacheensis]
MDIIEEAEGWVREKLLNETTGHDYYHIERVTKWARHLGEKEEADLLVVTLAALFHDLADDKVVASEEEARLSIRDWLQERAVEESQVDHIMEIIQTISFKGGQGERVRTLEAEVVQDADRLDAIGAIGIARTFQYAGAKGQGLYDPALPVRSEMTVEEYRNGKSSAVHHFYEKLLLLKDRMNTPTARDIAQTRHKRMELFLEWFYGEWEGGER